MPTRLRFPLDGPPPAEPHSHAAGLYRLVLDWLDRACEGLSAPVHDANQVKPLSISPVWQEEGRPYFEVSVLADWLLEPLLAGAAGVETARLGTMSYRIGRPEVVLQAAFESMRAGRSESAWGFRLLSPTAHRPAGPVERQVVLPAPDLYFGSWLGRWNLCCEEAMDPALLEIARSFVEVEECDGSTRSIHLPRGSGSGSARTAPDFTGFVGQVRFRAIPKAELSRQALGELTALARFASFSGTGRDTMRGMGQTNAVGGKIGKETTPATPK